MLEDVIETLNKDCLPALDAGEQSPREGGWFRFHRDLRFGFGADNDTNSVAALIFVDREPVDERGRAGLLMNASPWHLREPYRPDAREEIFGARSGSSTGYLFRWLETVRKARESDETIGTDKFDEPLFERDRRPDGPPEPIAM